MCCHDQCKQHHHSCCKKEHHHRSCCKKEHHHNKCKEHKHHDDHCGPIYRCKKKHKKEFCYCCNKYY